MGTAARDLATRDRQTDYRPMVFHCRICAANIAANNDGVHIFAEDGRRHYLQTKIRKYLYILVSNRETSYRARDARRSSLSHFSFPIPLIFVFFFFFFLKIHLPLPGVCVYACDDRSHAPVASDFGRHRVSNFEISVAPFNDRQRRCNSRSREIGQRELSEWRFLSETRNHEAA